MRWLSTALLAAAGIDAFTISHAGASRVVYVPRLACAASSLRMCDIEGLDPNSREYREAKAAQAAAIKAERLELATTLEFTEAEVDALTEASKCLEPCWQGDMKDLPKALKSPFGMPEDFFGQLRSPKDDPAPEALDAVRQKWTVLADRDDQALLAALQPIKDVYVDRRSLR